MQFQFSSKGTLVQTATSSFPFQWSKCAKFHILFLVAFSLTWSHRADAMPTAIDVRNPVYAATDARTRKPLGFFKIAQASAEIDLTAALGPEIHFKISLPATLIGDHTPPTVLSVRANPDGQLPNEFGIFGPTATGYCTNRQSDITCKMQYVLSYLRTVDFDQAAVLSREQFESQPAVLKDALSSIQNFRFDPEGVLKFHLGQ